MLRSEGEIAAVNADADFVRLMEESGLTVSKVHLPIVPEIVKHMCFLVVVFSIVKLISHQPFSLL